MTVANVQEIYDNLLNLEHKINGGKAYPIHKKLLFEEEHIEDVYQWLVQYIDFEKGSKVLDAGCGVGFGSCLIAKSTGAHVTGISLSKQEIEKAKLYSNAAKLNQQTVFQFQSFDDLGVEKYDKIIAVESVKHSFDLDRTLTSLKEALAPKGQLIIVEDFYQKNKLNADATHYIADWHLLDAFRLADYYAVLDAKKCQIKELTPNMPTKSKWTINSRLMFTKVMHFFKKSSGTNIYKIFRGGYYLDKLYAEGLMKYSVLIYENKQTNG